MSRVAVLGVDGGGTSTTAWVADADGQVIGRGVAGPSNIKAVGPTTAMESLDRSIARALDDAGEQPGPIPVSCLGLAGFDRPEDKAWLRRWADGSNRGGELILVNDADLVIAAGTPDGWGAGLIAGTGSIALGRSADGRARRCGGWGHLMGDEGSGFGVAVAALRILVRRIDGRDPPLEGSDPLAEQICAGLGIADPAMLVSAVYEGGGFDRTRIASLAGRVVEAARDDPSLVDRVLRPAGEDLAEMVANVARGLQMDREPLPLAMAGGFLLATPFVRQVICERLESLGIRPMPAEVSEPVAGAVALGRRALRS